MKKIAGNEFVAEKRLRKSSGYFFRCWRPDSACVYLPCFLGGQEIDLLISPGKLSKSHAHLAGVANCSKCHT